MSLTSLLSRIVRTSKVASRTAAVRRRMFFEPLEERRVLTVSPICDCGGGGGGGGWALDAEFGAGGLTQTPGPLHERIFDIAQLGNDIIAVGDDGNGDILVARYNASGTLIGSITVDFGGFDQARSVAIDGDKIVVAGNSDFSNLAIARIDSLTGLLDNTFSGDGTFKSAFPLSVGSGGYIEDIAIDADHSIVAVGAIAAVSDWFVARVTAAGDYDSSFDGIIGDIADGEDGVVIVDLGSQFLEEARGVAIQPLLGEIVVGGFTIDDQTLANSFAAARLLPNGQLDASFDGDGKQTIAVNAQANDMILAGNNVVLVGATNAGAVTLAQLTSSGAIDTSFGGGGTGYVITDIDSNPGTAEAGNDVAVQADGGLVVAGAREATVGGTDFLLLRYTSAGVLDASFPSPATTGYIATDFEGGPDIAHAIAIQPDGKIVLAGEMADNDGNEGLNFALARYAEASGEEEHVLTINGTSAADTIRVSTVDGGVEAFLNSVSLGVFVGENAPCKIVVNAGGGDDDVQIAGSITLSAWLYGGAGNDRLKGGSGHDILLGEEGDDLLVGGSGRDILIGGVGADRIVGNADDDILIAGTTDHDGSSAALCAILDEWTSSRDVGTRMHNIDGTGTGDRQNGDYFLKASTVHDDNARDVMTGSSGFDWFFANLGSESDQTKDKITDLSAIEFANDLAFIGP